MAVYVCAVTSSSSCSTYGGVRLRGDVVVELFNVVQRCLRGDVVVELFNVVYVCAVTSSSSCSTYGGVRLRGDVVVKLFNEWQCTEKNP